VPPGRFIACQGVLQKENLLWAIPKPNLAQLAEWTTRLLREFGSPRAMAASGAYSCETAGQTREWMEALARFLRRHRPLLEAHVVNFFKVPPPPLPYIDYYFLVSADWRLLLAQVSTCWGLICAGSAVGGGGRGVD
jgi:hypothetical protein